MDRMHGIRQFIRIIPWNAPSPPPRKKSQSINISSPKPLNIIVGTTECLHCFDSLFCSFFFFILIHSSSIPPSMGCNNRSFYGVQCINLKFNNPTNALTLKDLHFFQEHRFDFCHRFNSHPWPKSTSSERAGKTEKETEKEIPTYCSIQ